jgi:hypothetical protein
MLTQHYPLAPFRPFSYWAYYKDYLRPQVAKIALWTVYIAIHACDDPGKILLQQGVQVILSLGGSWALMESLASRADVQRIIWNGVSGGARQFGHDRFGITHPLLGNGGIGSQDVFAAHSVKDQGAIGDVTTRVWLQPGTQERMMKLAPGLEQVRAPFEIARNMQVARPHFVGPALSDVSRGHAVLKDYISG